MAGSGPQLVDLFNKALGNLALNPISSVTDGSLQQVVLSRLWPNLRRSVLASNNWGCSTSIRSLSSFQDVLLNADFEVWTGGASVAPDSWTLSGAGAAVAREAVVVYTSTYSAKLTRSGTDLFMYQDFYTVRGINYWKGKTVTFTCWVYATTPGAVRLRLDDGVGTTDSLYHTGNSTWQQLTVTRTISSNATIARARLDIANTDTVAYYDTAFIDVDSFAAPLNWLYAYLYPATALAVWKVYDPALVPGLTPAIDNDFPNMSLFQQMKDRFKTGTDFRVVFDELSATKIILSNTLNAVVEYSFDLTDTTWYHPDLVDVMALGLAAEAGPSLTGDKDLVLAVVKAYNMANSDAQRTVGYETDENARGDAGLIDSRG